MFSFRGPFKVLTIAAITTMTLMTMGISPSSARTIKTHPKQHAGSHKRSRAAHSTVRALQTAAVFHTKAISSYPSPDAVDIVAGPDGNLWFTDVNGNAIDQMNTAGVVTNVFTGNASSVSTAIVTPQDLTFGSDGAIWFINNGGTSIGRLDPTSGVVSNITDPSFSDLASIAAGSKWRAVGH